MGGAVKSQNGRPGRQRPCAEVAASSVQERAGGLENRCAFVRAPCDRVGGASSGLKGRHACAWGVRCLPAQELWLRSALPTLPAPHLRQPATRHLLPRPRRLLLPPPLQVMLLLVPILPGHTRGGMGKSGRFPMLSSARVVQGGGCGTLHARDSSAWLAPPCGERRVHAQDGQTCSKQVHGGAGAPAGSQSLAAAHP